MSLYYKLIAGLTACPLGRLSLSPNAKTNLNDVRSYIEHTYFPTGGMPTYGLHGEVVYPSTSVFGNIDVDAMKRLVAWFDSIAYIAYIGKADQRPVANYPTGIYFRPNRSLATFFIPMTTFGSTLLRRIGELMVQKSLWFKQNAIIGAFAMQVTDALVKLGVWRIDPESKTTPNDVRRRLLYNDFDVTVVHALRSELEYTLSIANTLTTSPGPGLRTDDAEVWDHAFLSASRELWLLHAPNGRAFNQAKSQRKRTDVALMAVHDTINLGISLIGGEQLLVDIIGTTGDFGAAGYAGIDGDRIFIVVDLNLEESAREEALVHEITHALDYVREMISEVPGATEGMAYLSSTLFKMAKKVLSSTPVPTQLRDIPHANILFARDTTQQPRKRKRVRAHVSMPDVVQRVIPVIGLAGMGAESICAANSKFPCEKGDRMGFRTHPVFEFEWSYDPWYLWSKCLQMSEDGKLRLVSFTGDYRVFALTALRFPGIVMLNLSLDEHLRRINEWRANNPEVGVPLPDDEVARLRSLHANWDWCISHAPSGTLILDASASADECAAEIIKYVDSLTIK
jgi:hypothetical protein